MEVRDAITRAMDDVKVMSLDGYFLASAFSMTEEGKGTNEWTLLFYSAKSGKVRDCFVNDKFVTLGEEQPAQKEMAELETGGLEVSAGEAVETATQGFGKKTINILISLHTDKRLLWNITLVAADMTATSFEIDAKTGAVVKQQTVSLATRL